MTNRPIEIRIDPVVFNDVYLPYVFAPQREQIFFGGAASGKSKFIAQRVIIDLLAGGRNYLICRAVAATLRGSVWTEIRRVISEWNLSAEFETHATDRVITCNNGYSARFIGLDDAEKIKSAAPAVGALTDIWIEEATECAANDLSHLRKRLRGKSPAGDIPKRITLTFNPVLRSHWIFEKYFAAIQWNDDDRVYAGDGLLILRTTHEDNRFITAADRAELENEADAYFADVYTRGVWGILGDRIFTNVSVRDLSAMRDQFVHGRFGLDFGFADDPAAAVFTHFDRRTKTIYVYSEFVSAGLTNPALAAGLRLFLGADDMIICDSAEPKSIAELRALGIDARPARKGKDSIMFGIQWLRQCRIVVDPACRTFLSQISGYAWPRDRHGRAIAQPPDRDNDTIDALRYAYERDMNNRSFFL